MITEFQYELVRNPFTMVIISISDDQLNVRGCRNWLLNVKEPAQTIYNNY